MYKIACQTIVFGDHIKENIETILPTVKKMGYDGVEIGVRHLDKENPGYSRDLLKKNELELLAIHVGGNFLEPDSVQKQIDQFEDTLRFACELGIHYIFISGFHKKGKTEEDYKEEAAVYNRLGKMCHDKGVKLCFHNHDWEIWNDEMGFRTLMANTDPEYFRLVPDVGWVTRGGSDPVKFLSEFKDRIEVLHFKEFTAENSFTELGQGVVKFEEVLKAFGDLKNPLWLVAEQDKTTKGAEVSAQENYTYIAGICGR